MLSVTSCLLMTSCSDPQEKAQKRLKKQGIAVDSTAFLSYVDQKNPAMVKEFLTAGLHVDLPEVTGARPFFRAVKNGDYQTASLLLENGASLDDKRDETPVLLVAFQQNAVSFFGGLIDKGASVKTLLADGGSLLATAIREEKYDIAKLLLEKGSDPNSVDHQLKPALHWAIDKGNFELTKTLLEKGGTAKALDHQGTPALVTAVRKKDEVTAKKLIEHGAEVNATAEDQRSVITLALEHGMLSFVYHLLERGADPNKHAAQDLLPIHQALKLEKTDLDLYKAFVKAKANLAEPSTQGLLPVEIAFIRGRYDLATVLLDANAPAGNAMHDAVERGDQRATTMMLERGHAVNVYVGSDTLLGLAVRSGRIEMAKMLIDKGADVHALAEEGQKPFHLALVKRDVEMIKLLLQHGADPSEPFLEPVSDSLRAHMPEGRMRWFLAKDTRVTPLMVAADTGNLDLVKLLMDAGANKDDYTRKHRMWALNFAIRNTDFQTARLLLEKDPNVEERHVTIDLSDQKAVVTNSDGTVALKFSVSTGKKGHKTPTGSYIITNKYRDWTSTLYDAKMPYFQRFSCGDFGLHQGNVPGYPASHGCVRVPGGIAKKLFGITKVGDRVEIVP